MDNNTPGNFRRSFLNLLSESFLKSFLVLIVINIFSLFSFGEIASDELKGIWRDQSCQQYVYVFPDLSWKARVIEHEQIVKLEGSIVVTTMGENEQGTVAVFLKKKGDNGWANVALILDSKDEEITDDTILKNENMILKKEHSALLLELKMTTWGGSRLNQIGSN